MNIVESDQEISNKIIKALIPQVNQYLKKSLNYIRKALPITIKTILENTPEYNSLINGQLKYEFGIPDAANKLATIIDIWSSNVYIEYSEPTIVSNQIKAFFSVSLIRSDYSDVLSSDASLVTDSLRGYQLPWLEWLLLEGNKTIVKNQEVVLGANKFSRTGYAIMKPSQKSWKVPSEFAGTSRDNWITRAIDGAESEINELLTKAFKQ